MNRKEKKRIFRKAAVFLNKNRTSGGNIKGTVPPSSFYFERNIPDNKAKEINLHGEKTFIKKSKVYSIFIPIFSK